MEYHKLLIKIVDYLNDLSFSQEQKEYFQLLASQVQFQEIQDTNIENGFCQYYVNTVDHNNKYYLKNEKRTCFMSFPYINNQKLAPVIQIDVENQCDDQDIVITHEIVHLLSSYDDMDDHMLLKRIGINEYRYQYQDENIVGLKEKVYDILNEILTEIVTKYLCINILDKEPLELSFSSLDYENFIAKRLIELNMNIDDFVIAYLSRNIGILERILGYELITMEKLCHDCYRSHKKLSIERKDSYENE